MDLGVAGMVFLIAGASKGLGLAIARCLAREGAAVAIASRSADAIARTAAELDAVSAAGVTGTACDVRDDVALAAWVAASVRRFGRIDGVVCNAGGPPPGGFDAFDDTAWQEAYELTLLSTIRLIRHALPQLRVRGGSILTLTSATVREPAHQLLLSSVMRSGVAALAKSLSHELAADRIRVNNLVPGLIATDRMIQLDAYQARNSGSDAHEVRRQRERAIPLGRYGEPEEFGRAGAFLLSPAASYISGASLVVDGATMRAL